MHHLTDRITHTTAFVTPVVEHQLEREIAQWVLPRSYISLRVHHEGSIRWPIAPWANALTMELHLALGPPWRINPTTHRTMSERSYHGATSRSSERLEGSVALFDRLTVHPDSMTVLDCISYPEQRRNENRNREEKQAELEKKRESKKNREINANKDRMERDGYQNSEK